MDEDDSAQDAFSPLPSRFLDCRCMSPEIVGRVLDCSEVVLRLAALPAVATVVVNC